AALFFFGMDDFQHLLPDYILGRNRNLLDVAGCTSEGIVSQTTGHHAVQVDLKQIGTVWYVISKIQLFVGGNLPIYEVVVGEASPTVVRDAQAGQPKSTPPPP